MDNPKENPAGTFKPRPYYDYLNYFGKDKRFHTWFAEKRTNFFASIFPRFVKWGLAPDTISYLGISLLAGVFLYFVRRPLLAVVFLAGHVILDGLDGSFARHTGKASQSGAFTDLVCDQLGMVIVSLLAIFHHMVYPVLGAVYITLYLIVVVFGVIINAMGLETRITITSKYFLYMVYAIWAGWQINFFPVLMSFFSCIMAVEVVVGYLRLKSGIRKKFDSQIKFAPGASYSGRLNYALNVAIPITALLFIVVWGNWTPIRSMLDTPKLRVNWAEGLLLPLEDETIIGIASDGTSMYLMTRSNDKTLAIKKITANSGSEVEYFIVPEYVAPAITTFPVDDNVLLIADSTTRLLLGFDLKASFSSRRAVIVHTLPMEYLHITAMATGIIDNRTVWLAANYLYNRKTFVIDPPKSIKNGKLLAGVIGSYVNAGFPSGMAIYGGYTIEHNKSPFQSLIYTARVDKIYNGKTILNAAKTSFVPPTPDAFGPVIQGDYLIMVTPNGQTYRLLLKEVLPQN